MLNNQRVIVRWHVVFESRINPHYRHFESLDQLIKINNGINLFSIHVLHRYV